MTRTPKEVADAASAAADEEMMAALERAGVDMWQLGRLSTDTGLLVVERDDLNQELVFQSSPPWGRDRIIWRWHIWGSRNPWTRARLADIASGWEPDVASMVARVVAFLGMGKP